MRAIPLRSSDVDGLLSLRRILWRLEHVALLHEMSTAQSAPQSTPANASIQSGRAAGAASAAAAANSAATAEAEAEAEAEAADTALLCAGLRAVAPVPLPLLCAALTASSSGAEMVDDSQRAWSGQAHRTGCADYEELASPSPSPSPSPNPNPNPNSNPNLTLTPTLTLTLTASRSRAASG